MLLPWWAVQPVRQCLKAQITPCYVLYMILCCSYLHLVKLTLLFDLVSVLFDVEKSVDHHDPPDSHIWYANEYFLQSKVYSKKMAVYV